MKLKMAILKKVAKDKHVGLRSITYTVGWYDTEAEQHFSWRRSGADDPTTKTFNLVYIDKIHFKAKHLIY